MITPCPNPDPDRAPNPQTKAACAGVAGCPDGLEAAGCPLSRPKTGPDACPGRQ